MKEFEENKACIHGQMRPFIICNTKDLTHQHRCVVVAPH